jgi:putative ABC transport system permease protein
VAAEAVVRGVASLARRNLTRNRLRTALAALGIVIGVFAIATLGVLGTVVQYTAQDALGGLGNQVIVSPNADRGDEVVGQREITRIRRIAGDGAAVVPVRSGGGVVARGDVQTFATLYGIEQPGRLFAARDGRLPERHRRGAVLGSAVAADLGVGVGRTVTVGGEDYRVVAVLAEQESVSPVRPDRAVLLPPDRFGGSGASQVIVRADSGGEAGRIAAGIRERVNARVDRVEVLELGSIVAEIDRFFGLLNTFLLAIGGVSLLVAGVAILNVMLMSVSERREEIGVLRAVGVQRRDVLGIVLVEAGLLGAAGAVVGSLAAGVVAVTLLLVVPEVTVGAVVNARNAGFLVLALSFGVVVALLSGLYPAWQAASADPVQALRD